MITILFSKKHNDNSHKLSMKLNSEKFGFFFCRKNTRINVIFFFNLRTLSKNTLFCFNVSCRRQGIIHRYGDIQQLVDNRCLIDCRANISTSISIYIYLLTYYQL